MTSGKLCTIPKCHMAGTRPIAAKYFCDHMAVLLHDYNFWKIVLSIYWGRLNSSGELFLFKRSIYACSIGLCNFCSFHELNKPFPLLLNIKSNRIVENEVACWGLNDEGALKHILLYYLLLFFIFTRHCTKFTLHIYRVLCAFLSIQSSCRFEWFASSFLLTFSAVKIILHLLYISFVLFTTYFLYVCVLFKWSGTIFLYTD